ncbi:adrenodoxin-like [Actinia tenebrosa]|uniref:Adrenodoxin-like n=1 Tax=Actinia tenebrosa TaxID=6105 RepID=A0A6P8IVI2_ACTTE|nr:adrenodoxin-like [Actinia tenebrosa]
MASLARNFIRQSISLSAQPSRLLAARGGVSYFMKTFARCNSNTTDPKGKPKPQTVTISFIDRDGDKISVKGKVGDSLLDVAKDNDIDLEGACEGTLSCSTCHLIFNQEEMDKLNLDEPADEELDMLDLAYGLTDTSRLGCQITVTKDFEGITLTIPKAHRDVRSA